MKKLLLLFVISLGIISNGTAQITISENTTWSTDQILTQSVIIEEGAELTIEAGVTVSPIFLDVNADNIGDIGIEVNGTLRLNGEVCNRVVFTPFEETTDLHYWAGITINSVMANTNLSNFTMNYASQGLVLQSETELTNCFISDCPVGISIEETAIVTIEDSWIHDVPGCGIINIGGTLTINNSHLTENGEFGIANFNGIMIMGFCTVDYNEWGGIYIGSGDNDIQNSTISNNSGSGIEISEWIFYDDFLSSGTKGSAPAIVVHTSNIFGNASSQSTNSFQNSNVLSLEGWGSCSVLIQANVGQSPTWEIPMGYISSQSATMARYCNSTNSIFDRTYYLRNAYDDSNLGVATQSSQLNCGCDPYYYGGSKTFSGSFTPTDMYYWYIGANSTSSHGVWDPVTTITFGGYEVYSTVGDETNFDFTNNYWGTFINVNDLVYDVNFSNTDYSAFTTESFPFAFADVDDGLPNIDLGEDTNICEGTGIVLDAGNSGSDFYWTPGGFTSQTIEVLEAGTYTVEVTNSCGSSSKDITITGVDLLPLTPVSAIGQTLLCPNSSNTSYNTTAADYATEYEWMISPSAAGIISGTSTTGIVDWDESYIGEVFISVISINDCGTSSASDELTVEVINSPSAPNQAEGVTSFCGTPIDGDYTTGGTVLAETYTWSIEPALAGSINGTGIIGSVIWNPEFVGTAEISVTAEGFCGVGGTSTPLEVSVGVYEASITGNTQACLGETITLTGNEADEYEWTTGGDTQSIEVIVTEDETIGLTINDDEGCTDDTSISIVALDLPDASISGDTEICDGESTVLSASGGVSYEWSTDEMMSTITVSPSTETSYSVLVTDGNSCQGSADVTVVVNENPSISISGDDAICEGETTIIEADGANSYQWLDGPATATYTVSPTSMTTYSVTGTSSEGCSSSQEYTISIVDAPDAMISGNDLICSGDVTTLTASGGGTYLWGNGSEDTEIIVNPSESTSYSVTVTNAQDCSSSAQIFVEVSTVDGEISGDAEICLGETATLVASGGISYVWNTEDTGAVLNAEPLESTEYSVTITNEDECSELVSWVVIVNDAPAIPTIVLFGDELLSSSTSGNQWYYEGIPLANEINQGIIPTQNGNYWVVVTDENGCSSQSEPYMYDGVYISEEDELEHVLIKPNPTMGYIELSASWLKGEASITVYDVYGKLVISKNASEVSRNFGLDVSQLSDGTYFLQLSNNLNMSTTKFVVSR